MSQTRRHALKVLGAIGATCAFPFAGDELYGQHVHATLAQAPTAGPYVPAFFTPGEYVTVSRLTDVIIPATDTPGAAAAGVPEYVDRVVSMNPEHQPLMRAGLAWLETQARARSSPSGNFVSLMEAEQIAILQAPSDAVDRQHRDAQRRRFRTEGRGKAVYHIAITDRDPPARPSVAPRPVSGKAPDLPVQFFRLIKNLTADGYYTSRAGLLDELGYAGNTVLARFPGCLVPEH